MKSHAFHLLCILLQIPKPLAKPGGYDHRDALFGVAPYGGSIQQTVYYADSDLCDPNVDTGRGYPIRENDENGRMKPWAAPYILMVDRGGCTFVQKVRNAQRSGATAVLIADNTCLCSAGASCISDSGIECETREPIMADDGSGSDISIPSFLMYKQDADPIIAKLKANQVVRIDMSWTNIPSKDHVEYELWTYPSEPVSQEFLNEFLTAAISLGSHASFTPHMYIYDGKQSGCMGADGENQCYNLCTNHGRYCSTDPDNDLDKGISGTDVVRESLRRLCIWKYYGEQDRIGKEWWTYVKEFTDRCNNNDTFANEDCVMDAYNRSGVDGDNVARCMKDSGGLTGDTANVLLDKELGSELERGVVILPIVYVNNAVLEGALSVTNVFGAICAGYAEGTKPSICSKCGTCVDIESCIKAGGSCIADNK